MNDNSKDIAVLNTLLSTVYDSVKGYEESSRDVDSSAVKTLFHEGAKERVEVAHMLRDAVTQMGGDPTDSPSMLGAAHRAFLNLREMVSTREDKAIIEEVERGEDYLKEKFEAALKAENTSGETRSAIERAYQSVRKGHDQISQLKHGMESNA